jgi:hypothetical protein
MSNSLLKDNHEEEDYNMTNDCYNDNFNNEEKIIVESVTTRSESVDEEGNPFLSFNKRIEANKLRASLIPPQPGPLQDSDDEKEINSPHEAAEGNDDGDDDDAYDDNVMTPRNNVSDRESVESEKEAEVSASDETALLLKKHQELDKIRLKLYYEDLCTVDNEILRNIDEVLLDCANDPTLQDQMDMYFLFCKLKLEQEST